MFRGMVSGNPVWFRLQRIGWGVVPVSWKGWMYAVCWPGVILLPFLLILSRLLVPEALIWLAASIGMFCWDVRQMWKIIKSYHTVESELIDVPSESRGSHMTTQHFNLHLHR